MEINLFLNNHEETLEPMDRFITKCFLNFLVATESGLFNYSAVIHDCRIWEKSRPYLQYKQSKEVSISKSLELFKQVLWQECPYRVLGCTYKVVLKITVCFTFNATSEIRAVHTSISQ